MQRFKGNDAVFILPKYAHLYPAHSAVVSNVEPDPFRPIFNSYTLTFADGSKDNLFEFQIIEDVPDCGTLIARLTFDSRRDSAAVGTRGEPADRQMILQTDGFDLDMKIRNRTSHTSIMGQVLERGRKDLLKNLEVRLMKESTPLLTAISDSLGVFKFTNVPHGSLNILVFVPEYRSRILAAFSV
jgi:hypothetical protein